MSKRKIYYVCMIANFMLFYFNNIYCVGSDTHDNTRKYDGIYIFDAETWQAHMNGLDPEFSKQSQDDITKMTKLYEKEMRVKIEKFKITFYVMGSIIKGTLNKVKKTGKEILHIMTPIDLDRKNDTAMITITEDKLKVSPKDNPKGVMFFKKTDSRILTVRADCADFPDKLIKCEEYECEYTHLFIGELMHKNVVGMEGNKCFFIEEMPNNGRMECRLSKDERIEIAKYTKLYMSAISIESKVMTLPDGSIKAVEILDGKEIVNPIQKAMNNGACEILGYSDLEQDLVPDNFRNAIHKKYDEEINKFKSKQGNIEIEIEPSGNDNAFVEKLLPNWDFFRVTFSDGKSYIGRQFLAGIDKKTQRVLEFDERSNCKGILTILQEEDVRVKNKEDAMELGKILTAWGPHSGFSIQLFNHNEWAIYTGTFFKHKKGYRAKVDPEGKIIDLKYELKLKLISDINAK